MTETTEPTSAAPKKRGGGLSAMLLADLKAMAGGMGIAGAGSMKKAQLVDAIKGAQASGGARSSGPRAAPEQAPAQAELPLPRAERTAAGTDPTTEQRRGPRAAKQDDQKPADQKPADQKQNDQKQNDQKQNDQKQNDQKQNDQKQNDQKQNDQKRAGRQPQEQGRKGADDQGRPQSDPSEKSPSEKQTTKQGADQGDQRSESRDQPRDQGDQQDQGDQDGEGRGRNRRRRGRDRNRAGAAGGPAQGPQTNQAPSGNQGNQGNQSGGGNQGHQGQGGGQGGYGNQRHEPDTTILDDDVVVPAAGILDVLDNYAFVRTSGYLPGTDDVYLSLSMVRKFGLRRGDALVGQVRQPREGERREKFNPMVSIDSVNGHDPETAKNRVEFDKLTPLSPSERLRLETDQTNLIGRVIDVAAPIGKGQRGLVVAPAKAGRTTVLQSIATSISTNNPECHLMVVLVDERPEEVTDFERSVKGEVISSTFDRPATDHTTVAELAIERAKRLVELGHDVVVLLDGLTRLGRAYNLSTTASGRILPGGVDAAALHPPKKFFGAARNVENGGSLTIIATAVVESGSKTDEVIFEELRDTANMEVRLRRDFADKRLFPAIDAVQSGTRREELLMSPEELAIVWKLRRTLSALEGQQALELLLQRLQKTATNIEFLTNVQKTSLAAGKDG